MTHFFTIFKFVENANAEFVWWWWRWRRRRRLFHYGA